MLRRLSLSPSIKRTSSNYGHPRIETLPLCLTWATLPFPKVTFPPLKFSKEVKKGLYLEHPLSKYHSLGALALRAVSTTLHLGLSFLNHTCFTLGGELEKFFLVLGLELIFFSFLVCRIIFFRELKSSTSLFS